MLKPDGLKVNRRLQLHPFLSHRNLRSTSPIGRSLMQLRPLRRDRLDHAAEGFEVVGFLDEVDEACLLLALGLPSSTDRRGVR